MTAKKSKAPVIAEKKEPEITKKRGGARPNTGGKRPNAGRPPGAPNKVTASVREAAQVFSDEAVNTLAAIMKDGKAPAVARIAASNAILDRAHGRPHQSIDVEGGPMVAADPAALIALSEAMERSRMERRAIMERRRQMGFTGD
jgi:hypothetical protein